MMNRTIESATLINQKASSKLTRDIFLFIGLAYAIAWTSWIVVIKANLGEEYLNIGVAGPSIAAIVLSLQHKREKPSLHRARWIWFSLLTGVCWLILSAHYQWRAHGGLRFHPNPWTLLPSILPAWILSGIFSKDAGVRSFIARLVHWPNRWSLYALMCWPVFLLIPAAVAHVFHLPLVSPPRAASAPFIVLQGAGFYMFNVLFVGVEEEPGWRGFLLDRLQLRFSPLLASILVWIPWSLWHVPLDCYRPVRMSIGVWLLVRVVTAIPINVLLVWFYNKSGRSIQTTALFHAGMNTFPFVLPYYQPASAVLFVWAGFAVFNARMWRAPARAEAAPSV